MTVEYLTEWLLYSLSPVLIRAECRSSDIMKCRGYAICVFDGCKLLYSNGEYFLIQQRTIITWYNNSTNEKKVIL